MAIGGGCRGSVTQRMGRGRRCSLLSRAAPGAIDEAVGDDFCALLAVHGIRLIRRDDTNRTTENAKERRSFTGNSPPGCPSCVRASPEGGRYAVNRLGGRGLA